MGIKRNFEQSIFNFYRWTRKISAERRRIKEFTEKVKNFSLSKEQEQQIKKFYSPYKVPNMVFHKYFTGRSGVFYPEYIPQDIYVGYIDPYFNDIIGAKFLDNKCLYDAIFHGIPQPEILLKRVNKIWLDEKNTPVIPNDMEKIIHDFGGERNIR